MVPREIQKLLFEYKNGFGEEILDPNEPGISYDEKVNRIYKIFEREAKFHIIFERIHPFNDENEPLVKNATYPQNAYKLGFSN